MYECVVSVHAVVALRSLDHGKRRLAGALTGRERHKLIQTMMGDVLATLRGTSGVAALSVLTGDASLVPPGCSHIRDPGLGLNAAVSHAARVLVAAGASAMLVLPADLPFLGVEDIHALIDAGRDHAIVLAPDAAGCGTNALLVSPPGLIAPHFGLNSCAAHAAAARALGAKAHLVHRPGLSRDIDEPQHLRILIAAARPRYAFLVRALRQAS
jgi:2-phospho-L-lactate guanylyltransferase